ncbi:MAG: DUF4131 domain-containing protein [Nitrospira sp.]|nr:MAG: DUF4131 domain-containing protein [Nitrospira sp.]
MLPPLTVAFIAGLLIGSQISYFPLSSSFLLLLVALAAVVLERFSWLSARKATWLYGAFVVGVIYWAVVVNLFAHGPMAEHSPDAQMTGRIVAPVQLTPDQLVMTVRMDGPIDGLEASTHVRLTWRMPERILFQGDRVGFLAPLRRPSGSLNPGGFDYASYLERQGIDMIATVTGSDAVKFIESGNVHAIHIAPGFPESVVT